MFGFIQSHFFNSTTNQFQFCFKYSNINNGFHVLHYNEIDFNILSHYVTTVLKFKKAVGNCDDEYEKLKSLMKLILSKHGKKEEIKYGYGFMYNDISENLLEKSSLQPKHGYGYMYSD